MRELMHILYIHFKCKKVKSLIRGYFETFPTIVLYLFQVIDPNRLVQVVLCSFHAKKVAHLNGLIKCVVNFMLNYILFIQYSVQVLCPSFLKKI